MRSTSLFLALGLLAGFPSAAAAWSLYGYPWTASTAEMQIHQAGFPAGSAEYRGLEESLLDWNRVPDCTFLFRYSHTAASGNAFDHSDHVSGIAFGRNLGSGVLAVTYAHDHAGTRHAADILFATWPRWSYDRAPGRGQHSFASVSRHELGHALGLRHENQIRAVMRSTIPSGRVYPLTADDMTGARRRYRGPSRHGPDTFPIGGQVDWRLTSITVQPRAVRPGDTVTVSYTVENAGTETALAAPVRHYLLSTNPQVTTQDQLLLEAPRRNQTYAPGETLQGGPWQVQIPTMISPGQYFLGVLIDPAGVDAEADETNNASSVPLVIQGPTGTPNVQVDWSVAPLQVQPARVRVGQAVTITYRVSNVGPATASQVPELRLYLSDNPTVTTQDTFLAGELGRGGVFATGQGYGNSQSIGILTLAPGTYTIGAMVDPDGLAAEARKDNNVGTVTFEVLPP